MPKLKSPKRKPNRPAERINRDCPFCKVSLTEMESPVVLLRLNRDDSIPHVPRDRPIVVERDTSPLACSLYRCDSCAFLAIYEP